MNTEFDVRIFLGTLSNKEISDSVYLVDLDFDFDDYDTIIDRIISLHNDVLTIKNMVEHGFKSKIGEELSKEKRNEVIQDCYKKAVVLSKLLGNPSVKEAVVKRMVAVEKAEKRAVGLM